MYELGFGTKVDFCCIANGVYICTFFMAWNTGVVYPDREVHFSYAVNNIKHCMSFSFFWLGFY
jgi:hypothetical protein